MPQTPSLDPMTAPLQEVLDWLAQADGWTRPDDLRGYWAKGDGPRHEREIFPGRNPMSLDRLSRMLDDTVGVSLYKLPRVGVCDARWTAHAWSRGLFNIATPDRPCPTAIESLARVVAAVKMMEAAR